MDTYDSPYLENYVSLLPPYSIRKTVGGLEQCQDLRTTVLANRGLARDLWLGFYFIEAFPSYSLSNHLFLSNLDNGESRSRPSAPRLIWNPVYASFS